ncbi:MAG TPA: GNAT family N-acetyltransferase [Acidimicrobiales bacterium]|nr:GNAT family N-acetyltransferase [Acidimicrobiales bacterium]
MSEPELHVATVDDLDVRTLHDLLRLRIDVFVVEQACAYPELDGRDVEPATRHWWLADGSGPVAVLRTLGEADGTSRLGRVVTRADRRGEGLAARLVRAALTDLPRPVRIDAQSHLADWYVGFGFVRDGDEFVEDGIPHLPMRLG